MQELADNGSATVYRYRHEDQAGSLIGVTDEDGFRTDEYFYLDFGTPIHRPILFDGGAGEIESITANTPSAGYTRIGLYGDYLTADALIGKQLRALGSLHVGEVYDNGTDTIDVVDPTGAIYTAIYGNLNIVVMDFDAPAVEPVALGTWTAVTYDELNEWTVLEDTSASFNTTVTAGDLVQPALWYSDWHEVASVLSASQIAVAGDLTGTIFPLLPYRVTDPIWSYSSDVSTYTNNSANFEDWMLGWLFTPDVNEPCYLQVIEVTSATSIKVKGDARGLSQPDDQWRIHAPPGVDNTTGGLHTDLTEAGSRYLYGNMRYMPPQAGFDVSGTIFGVQGGPSVAGNYYSTSCYYHPSLGLWTTTTPWVFFSDSGDRRLRETIDEILNDYLDDNEDPDRAAFRRLEDYVRRAKKEIKDELDRPVGVIFPDPGHGGLPDPSTWHKPTKDSSLFKKTDSEPQNDDKYGAGQSNGVGSPGHGTFPTPAIPTGPTVGWTDPFWPLPPEVWNPNDGWDWLWKWSDPDNTPLHPDHTTPLDPYGPGAGFHKPFHDLPLLKKYKDWPVWFKPFEVWGGGGSGVDDRPYGRLGFGYKFGRLRIYGWGEGGVDDAGFPGMTGGGIGVGIQWNVEPIFMRTR